MGVGDAVADVFGEGGESGGRGRVRGGGAIWCDDSYFCCAEFA